MRETVGENLAVSREKLPLGEKTEKVPERGDRERSSQERRQSFEGRVDKVPAERRFQAKRGRSSQERVGRSSQDRGGGPSREKVPSEERQKLLRERREDRDGLT